MSEPEPPPTPQELLPAPPDPQTDDPDLGDEYAPDDGASWSSWLADHDRDSTEKTSYSDMARAAFVDRSGGVGAAARARLKRHRDPDRPRRNRPPLSAVFMLVGVAVLVVVVLGVNLGSGSPRTAPARSAPGTTVASTASAPATTESYPHATADCYATKTGDTVVGAGPGDPTTGPGAILGFEWAYYADRSGARARDWVTPDASVLDAAAIQAGIDATPVATKYCVHITRAAADGTGSTWNVTLSEQYPTDKTPQQWTQTITTTTSGGRVLITAIRKAQ
ncbi:hypothetical protein ACFXHA_43375 [Nocardia sp. NPDC059240]|uniref:hypothetical protein n=1 Tax=Nocardia sp. NPDC059240 TaxID=3346786 RepID=UPI0036C603EC